MEALVAMTSFGARAAESSSRSWRFSANRACFSPAFSTVRRMTMRFTGFCTKS
jgi:hypothetical protein